MFNSRHYVPILRWKAAEKEAIGQLEIKNKNMITPLIEFIMPQPPEKDRADKNGEVSLDESINAFKAILPKIPTDVLKFWGQGSIFVDFHHIDASIRANALSETLSLGKQLDIFMIPVINLIPVIDLDSDVSTREVAVAFSKKNNRGICLRLTRADLNESLIDSINNLVTTYEIAKKDIDLIVDFLIIEENDSSLESLIGHIPEISQWRTFTVAGGAFPPDLTRFSSPDLYRIPRYDWASWKNLCNKLPRKPSFADYTIQHPIYKAPVLRANPSASIRYATNDEWLIMKGQGLYSEKSAGFKQYPANAQLLSEQDEFKAFGEAFSYGDMYISEVADHKKGTGNPRTWLRAGINHHMACTANQLANLS